MKKFSILIIISFITIQSFSQTDGVSKPIAEIYADYHASLKTDNTSHPGFALNRAFFGYNFALDQNFYAVIILNIGSTEDLAIGSKPRRYPFFREASANYTNKNLTVTAGMIKTTLFIYQQNFIGMRYIAKPFQDYYNYGGDSDLGLSASYKFSDAVQADLSIVNGEGGGSLQTDNYLKYCGGIVLHPWTNIYFRLYDELMKNNSIIQNGSVVFAGIKTEKFFAGAEFNYKSNLDTVSGHNGWGLSATGGINLSQKYMLFSRYDFSGSSVPAGESNGWDYGKDAKFFIFGLQYSATKNVRVALNYQGRYPDDPTKSSSQMIFINLGFKL
jgi:hypothetical protein